MLDPEEDYYFSDKRDTFIYWQMHHYMLTTIPYRPSLKVMRSMRWKTVIANLYNSLYKAVEPTRKKLVTRIA